MKNNEFIENVLHRICLRICVLLKQRKIQCCKAGRIFLKILTEFLLKLMQFNNFFANIIKYFTQIQTIKSPKKVYLTKNQCKLNEMKDGTVKNCDIDL